MPPEWSVYPARLKAIEREYTAVALAVARFLAEARRDPTIIQGDADYRDIQRASSRVEATYLVRLFAEFESALRQFWSVTHRTRSPRSTESLLTRAGSHRRIPDEQIKNAHRVRVHRNSL